MCYSAMVKQHMKKLGLDWQSRTQLDLFENLFKRRASGEKITVSPALENNFLVPANKSEELIKQHIDAYRAARIREEESELFSQKTRLTEAERKLALKPTKTAQKEKEVSARQIERIQYRLKELKSAPDPASERIYSKYYAPLIVFEKGERVIKPMRYLCRPMGFSEDFDKDYPGCYNARRDSLQGFWKKQFMRHHGVLIISSFFENVKLHDFEKRKLSKDEKEQNIVIEFKPEGFDEMIIPCIWDLWKDDQGQELYSFAIITDEPPPEVRAAGHDRCPIFIKKENIDRWLQPVGLSEQEINAILDDRETPFYQNQKVA